MLKNRGTSLRRVRNVGRSAAESKDSDIFAEIEWVPREGGGLWRLHLFSVLNKLCLPVCMEYTRYYVPS